MIKFPFKYIFLIIYSLPILVVAFVKIELNEEYPFSSSFFKDPIFLSYSSFEYFPLL
jgi:hypothetical protein